MKWFIKVLRHYADFSGRARRKEFWMFVLFNIIFSFIWTFLLTIVFVLVNNNELSEEKLQFAIRVAYMSYSAAMLLPGLAVAVRRMHDLGKSGWMLLVGLIPFLGGIWLFVLMLMDSQERGNKYGPNPKTSQETFSEPVRLKNAGVTLVIASTIAFLINIFNLISNQFPIQFNNMVEIAVDIILFAAGIFLLNEHSISKMQKKGQYAFVLILTVASIHLIISTYFLNINISNVSTFGWKAVTGSTIYTLYNLMIALFAASVLFYLQNKNLIRSLAVMTMAFSGIFLLWSAFSRMGFFYAGFEIVNILGIFFVLMPVAYMVLAGTFYSVRNSTGEKSKPDAVITPNREFSKDTIPVKETVKSTAKERIQQENVRFSIASFQPVITAPGFTKEDAYQLLNNYLVNHEPQKMSKDETELLKPLFINLLMYFKNAAVLYSQSGRGFGGTCDACNGPISKNNFYLTGSWARCRECVLESIVISLDWNYYLSHIVQGIGQVPDAIISQAYDIKDKIVERREALS